MCSSNHRRLEPLCASDLSIESCHGSNYAEAAPEPEAVDRRSAGSSKKLLGVLVA